MFKLDSELSSSKKLFVIILCFCLGFIGSSCIVGVLYFFVKGEVAGKILLILSSILSFGLPAAVAAVFIGRNKNPFGYIGMTSSPGFVRYILIIVFMLALMPTIEFLSSLNASYSFPDSMKGLEDIFRKIDEQTVESTRVALSGSGLWMFILNLITIAITPAICEEMFFRGILQRFFTDTMKNKHVAILLTAFIFSAIHIQFSGLLPRFILGAILGYLFYYSKSLWSSIVAHALNNALVVCLVYFGASDVAEFADLETFANPWWIAAIVGGLAIAALIGRMLFRKNKVDNALE